MASRHHQLCVSRPSSVVSDSARKPLTTWASGGICLCEHKHLQQTDVGHWRKLWLSMNLWCNGTSFLLLSCEMQCAWVAQCIMLLLRVASQLNLSMSTVPQVYHSLASASLLHGFSKRRMTLQSFLSAGSMLWHFYGVVHILCTIPHACREVNITIWQIKSCSCRIALADYCNKTALSMSHAASQKRRNERRWQRGQS